MQNMTQDEERWIIAKEAGPYMLEVSKEEILIVLYVGVDEEKTGFKNSSFKFIEDVFTEMAIRACLNELQERKVERWTQSSQFVDSLIFVC